MQFRDISEITVSGRNPYPFINAVRESPIPCYEQHCTGEIFHCRIRTSDLPDLREIADAYGVQVESRRPRSVQRFFWRYRLRFGLLLGMLAACCLIFWQSNVVETIELQGNTTVSADSLRNVLAGEGVQIGTWIPGIDMKRCELTIRRTIPGIAWCGIRHTGSRLVVEIYEETPHIPMHHSRAPCNIVAREDAQITDVTVYDGYLKRLPGSGVAKGDLIVSGTFEDAFGRTTFHHAYAKITGIYTKEAELTVYRDTVSREPPGRISQRRILKLFGMQIPLTFGAPAYEASRKTVSEVPVYFLGWRLPVSMRTETETELSETTLTRSAEELQLALQSEIVRYEQHILDDVTILDRRLEYTKTEDALTCRMRYQVEGEIGEEREFFVN